jgi:frataxin-like iron-binding protein CyaY
MQIKIYTTFNICEQTKLNTKVDLYKLLQKPWVMYSALDVSISYFTSNLAFLKVQNTNETNTQKNLIPLMGHSIASQAHARSFWTITKERLEPTLQWWMATVITGRSFTNHLDHWATVAPVNFISIISFVKLLADSW